jgi:hypothetical protein
VIRVRPGVTCEHAARALWLEAAGSDSPVGSQRNRFVTERGDFLCRSSIGEVQCEPLDHCAPARPRFPKGARVQVFRPGLDGGELSWDVVRDFHEQSFLR